MYIFINPYIMKNNFKNKVEEFSPETLHLKTDILDKRQMRRKFERENKVK